jgi:ComF family protein
MKNLLLNILFPQKCLLCNRFGAWLCPDCRKKIATCNYNQDFRPQTSNNDIDRIFIAGHYDHPGLGKLIKKFKYEFFYALGETLGKILADFWSNQIFLLSINNALLVPIPLSKKRRRWRGFNQAEILTRVISRDFGYQFSDALKRPKETRPQAELPENERLKNAAGCFDWTGENLNGRTVIIIDDVITTGATMQAAARVLKTAGAGRIYGLALAKG